MKREDIPELTVYRQILEETPRSLLQDTFYDFCNAEKAEQHLFRVANFGGGEYMLAYRDWKLAFLQNQLDNYRKEIQQHFESEVTVTTGDVSFDNFMTRIRKLRFEYRLSPLQAVRNHIREESEELQKIADEKAGVYLNVWNNYKLKSFKEVLQKHDWKYHASEDPKHYEQMQSNEQILFEYACEQGPEFIELFEVCKNEGTK